MQSKLQKEKEGSLNVLAKLQAGKFGKTSKQASVLSQIASKMAHAEEIDPRLNRRKDTIIKLQTYIMDNAENDDFDSDEDDSRESSNGSDDESPPNKF